MSYNSYLVGYINYKIFIIYNGGINLHYINDIYY